MRLFLVLLVCVQMCESYPNGMVSSSCGDLNPSHGTSVAQTSPAPYIITTDNSVYKGGDTITVTLSATSGGKFTGFLLEARQVGGNSVVGSFSLVGSTSQLLGCSGLSTSAVSHTSSSSKTQVQSKWIAPTSGNLNNIEFRATFVRDYATFWVGVKSGQITYNASSTGTSPSGAPSPTSFSPSGAQSPTSSSSTSSISNTGCGIYKTCVSQPDNCSPSTDSNCYFMSATPLPSGFMYEISGRATGYVAIAFSDDNQMGNDDVYICGKDTNGMIQLQHAFSTGTTTPTTMPLGNVTVLNTSLINDVISCSFISRNIITTSTRSSSTPSTPYYIFIANGATTNGVIQMHKAAPIISSTKVDMTNPSTTKSSSGFPAIVKAHGCLMLIAWMTTGSLGMMIARCLKRAFPGQRLCGKDFWFLAHTFLMLLTVVATIIAFILIFSFAQDWSGGAHPVLGCLVMILSLVQPIAAIFRCSPDDDRRFIFNWFHGMNALGIKGLAVAAIFTGLMMVDMTSSQWLLKVMGGFVAWEALLFLCQDIYHRCNEKDMDGMDSSGGGVSVGVLLLMIFLLGNLAFLVALFVGIGQS